MAERGREKPLSRASNRSCTLWSKDSISSASSCFCASALSSMAFLSCSARALCSS
uniref:Uncharacterized protein n=1 Tax=Anguilla anguilla TaxID=7936 RepID=A0A0E9V9F8_ANGAN